MVKRKWILNEELINFKRSDMPKWKWNFVLKLFNLKAVDRVGCKVERISIPTGRMASLIALDLEDMPLEITDAPEDSVIVKEVTEQSGEEIKGDE